MNDKHIAMAAITVSCLALGISTFNATQRSETPTFAVADPSIHVWLGKTVDGDDAVCINGFAYHEDTIFDDRLLVPITGVREDERGLGTSPMPARAVRCKR